MGKHWGQCCDGAKARNAGGGPRGGDARVGGRHGRNRASVNGKGAFFEATVFDGVTPQMTIAREEIFGPVLATLTFKSEEEAVEIGNATIYGLAAAVWSKTSRRPCAPRRP
ncbi:MAG: aldehyde dehydrogenase family protein [Thermoanaerobaculia bacterium]